MGGPRRAYRSPTRRRQAAETRARILEAARSLVAEHGYEGTTVEAIAQAAGVAVQTVFAAFGSKRGLVGELLRQAQWAPAAEELRTQLREADDPVTRVRLAVAIGRRVYDQMAPTLHVLRGAGLVAPELAAVEREIEDRRHAGTAMLAEYLAARQALRGDITPSAAADLVWALTGPDLYRQLVVEQGWAGDDYERVLSQLLLMALLPPDLVPTRAG